MHLRDLTQFLSELNDNNNRPWFVMNRPRYDILRAEFLDMVTLLIGTLGKFDPAVMQCNPKKALFRINRDVRFAHDKSPYKTTFSAAILPNDLKRPSEGGGPCYYLQIDGKGKLMFGAGEYMPPPHRLRAIRNHIGGDAAGFAKLLKDKKMLETYGHLQDENKLARPPKGYDPAGPHIEQIQLKSFFVWTETALDVNAPDALIPRLAAGFKRALPLVTWLRSVPQAEPAPKDA
jgi:uncharacterized protein (TIGR02453 family)